MPKIPGYAGEILYVDLSSKESRREGLDPELVKDFLGGYGIDMRLACDLIPAGTDSYSPDNKIIIGAGPFNGTVIPGGAKLHIVTKYPINGGFARASGGGAFGLMMKSCGFDHIVVSGKADHPVYLKITDGQAEVCPADDLWGKDAYETVDLLHQRHEPCSVIPIGQAGENLVKISVTTIDKCGTVGRGGLPAVMGSKNLKAIVACQGTNGVEIADRRTLTRIVNHLLNRMQKWPGRDHLLEHGMATQMLERRVKTPRICQNSTKGHLATLDEIHGDQVLLEEYRASRKPLACPGCSLADKDFVCVTQGAHAGAVFYGNHLMHVKDTEERFAKTVVYSGLFNRYGIDSMDFFALASLVYFLYQRGILSSTDIGFEPQEQDFETNTKLLEMIAYRKGIGAVLAEGLEGAARIIGKGAEEFAYHIKGHTTFYDPRVRGFLGTMEFTEITNPKGAHVAFGGSPAYDPGRPIEDFLRHGERMGIPLQANDRLFSATNVNVGRLSRYSEDWCSLFDTIGLCNRAFVNRFYHIQTITELLAALTGIKLTPGELMKIAERNWNLWRALNARAGFNRKDDRPPNVWYLPLQTDEKEYPLMDYYQTRTYSEGDIDQLLDDYYDERGWDRGTGNPTPDKLRELGLGFLS